MQTTILFSINLCMHSWWTYMYTHTSAMCMSLIKLLTHFSTLWNRVQGSEQTKSDYELLYRTTDLVSAGRKDRSTCCRISSVQSLTCVWLFATPWIAARQASLSITNSRSSLKLTSIVGDAIQPSHPLSSPSPPAPNPSQLLLYTTKNKQTNK